MPLVDELKNNLIISLKSGESLKVETIRGLLASIHNREIEVRSEAKSRALGENEIVAVLRYEAKKRKEAAEIYTKAGRGDLADKENQEFKIIKSYLPPEISSAEIETVVRKIVAEGLKDFGKVMQGVLQEVAGRADAGKVSEIVKKVLEEGGNQAFSGREEPSGRM